MTHETQTNENIVVMNTGKDVATAILIVSVLVNLAVFVTYLWVVVDPAVNVAVNFS